MTASKAQVRASAKYDKANTKQFVIKLNKIYDADIIEKLETVENRQGYIKELILADMKRIKSRS